MDRPYLRKLQMYEAVLLYLQLNIIIWTASAAFTAEVAALSDDIDKIKEKDQINKKSKNVSKGKAQKLNKMIKDTSAICDAGVAYASSIDDDELRGTFDFSPSDLKDGSVEIVIARCKQIGKDAIPVSANLILWGMPAGHLAIQIASVAAYELAAPTPKAVITGGKSANKEMDKEFKVVDTQLKQRLDKLVNGYQAAQPEFVLEYYDKRTIGGWSKPKVVPPVPPTPPTV